MRVPSLRLRVLAGVAIAVTAASMGVAAAASSKPDQTTFRMFPQTSLLNCLKPHPNSPHARGVGHGRSRQPERPRHRVLAGLQAEPRLRPVHDPAQPADGDRHRRRESECRVSRGTSPTCTCSLTARARRGCARSCSTRSSGSTRTWRCPPTNTFHLGFWFNNPTDAQGCGFTGSTPFNGEHTAGPLAFVTRPNAITGLGPLCTDPISGNGGTFTCNP